MQMFFVCEEIGKQNSFIRKLSLLVVSLLLKTNY